jgi:large subunit ribosomal protein L15
MLHNTLANPLKKKRKRVGRGIAAGQGKTCGRGGKGQTARTGKKLRITFEGGQTPLFLKLPKFRGFRNPNKVEFQVVNLESLERLKGDKVNAETLAEAGLIKRNLPVKILGQGDIKRKLEVLVDAVSASAKDKIVKAGGSVEITEQAQPEEAKK